jgi:hypothetical protein
MELTWTTETYKHRATYATGVEYEELVSYSNTVDHGIVDTKGRAIGGYASIRSNPVNEKGKHVAYSDEPLPIVKVEYDLEIRATRNDKTFGAIPRRTTYDTLEAAQAAAVGKLIEQGKRYAKQAGAKAGI